MEDQPICIDYHSNQYVKILMQGHLLSNCKSKYSDYLLDIDAENEKITVDNRDLAYKAIIIFLKVICI